MQRYSLPDPRFLPLGRHDPKETQAHLWWSGSGVRLKTACTRLDIEVASTCTDHAAYMGVLMDGAPVCRFPIVKGIQRATALAGLDKGFAHGIAIIRDTQPSYDESAPVILNAIYTDGEIAPIEERPLLIEFIGDSLTVGEGCLGPESASEWRMMWVSHMPAFPTLVSEALGAEKRVIALGGWGAARSWDNQPESRIGRIYDRLCAVIPGGDVPAPEEKSADAVVINLGTNDCSALRTMKEEEAPAVLVEIRERAKELIRQARARNPQAHILWAYGLCGSDAEPVLRAAVEDIRSSGDERVQYLALSQAESNGSRMHPSRKAHRKAAQEITDALKKALKC